MIVSLRAVTTLSTIVLSVMLHISSRRILGALEPEPPVHNRCQRYKIKNNTEGMCTVTVIKKVKEVPYSAKFSRGLTFVVSVG